MIIKYSKNDDDYFEEMLINYIFRNLTENVESTIYMTSRAILASKIEYVDKLNEKIIQFFRGEGKTYTSFDEAIDDTRNFYPQEFLNTLAPNECLSSFGFEKKLYNYAIEKSRSI